MLDARDKAARASPAVAISPAMERIERIHALHRILTASRYPVTVQRLQEDLECSRATVYRDLAYLRDYLMAPVVGNGEAGFRYDAQRGRALRVARPVAQLGGTALAAGRAAAAAAQRRRRAVERAGAAAAPHREAARRTRRRPSRSGRARAGDSAPHPQARRGRVPQRRHRGARSQAARVRIPRAFHRRTHAPHGVAAAPHALSRELVPRRLGHRSRRAAQFFRRPHQRGARVGDVGAGRARRGTRSPPRVQLRHLFGHAQGLGDDRVQRQGRALGRRRALAFAAAGRGSCPTGATS